MLYADDTEKLEENGIEFTNFDPVVKVSLEISLSAQMNIQVANSY
jgi:hypothetical protein